MALVMVISTITIPKKEAYAAESYQVWVERVQFDSDNAVSGITIGDAKATYDASTNTITFDKSVKLTGSSKAKGCSIYANTDEELNIVFAKGTSNEINGVYAEKGCKITAEGADLTFIQNQSYSIFVGGVVIESAKNITVSDDINLFYYSATGNVSINATGDVYFGGTYSQRMMLRKLTLKVDGNVTFNAKTTYDYIGDYADFEIGGNLTIKNEFLDFCGSCDIKVGKNWL